jgi:23S rRNA (cytidine1920-2'-O)/16S rRNA (cytidine1409-2'-O)-methyltransferase
MVNVLLWVSLFAVALRHVKCLSSSFRKEVISHRPRMTLLAESEPELNPPIRSSKKMRIDEILVSRSMAQDINQAKALVMSGCVLLQDGEVVTSAAAKIRFDSEIRLKMRKNEPYVSRAGRKLAHAIETFNLKSDVEEAVCIDIGCSTGGFSDVLIQNNCSLVYAVDVGVSLLDWKIRNHEKVVVVEKQNARYLNSSVIPHAGMIGVIVCDVSFISLTMVLPPSIAMCAPNALLCALIKPQFECKRNEIGEGGIVRDISVRDAVVKRMIDWFVISYPDWNFLGTVTSPITGQDGNVEYVLVARRTEVLNNGESEIEREGEDL